MSLTVREPQLAELMDDPECDPERLRATLHRFGTVNRVVSGWGAVYRRTLAPHLASLDRRARVLDLGSGGGDLVLRLARLAARDGLDVEWTGADPDHRAHAVATGRDAPANVAFREASSTALLSAGDTFDAVISNHVLHHLDSGIGAFAADTRDLTTPGGLVLHSDIARSRIAYGLYAVGITPLAPGTFLRTDGLRSIRRSFTVPELQAELDRHAPGTWSVQRPAAFRLLAVASGRA